jgi:transposase
MSALSFDDQVRQQRIHPQLGSQILRHPPDVAATTLTLYADSGYQGPKFQSGLRRVCTQVNVAIVRRSDIGTFVVRPKRWIVERTIGWLNQCRRLAKDWECLNRNALAFLALSENRMISVGL